MRRPVSPIRSLLLTLLASAAAMLAPAAAHAVNLTVSGSGTSGVDPFGGGWTAEPNTFGFVTFPEPLVANELSAFNVDGLSNGAGTFATSFTAPWADGSDATGVVPGTASWAMMIGGVGLTGGALRRIRPTGLLARA